MFLRRLNIRWRLTLWFGVAMIVLLLIRSYWIYHVMDSRLVDATDAQLAADLQLIERYVHSAKSQDEVREFLDRFSMRHGDMEIFVRGPDGQLLYQGSSGEDWPEEELNGQPLDGSDLRHAISQTPDGKGRVVRTELPSALGKFQIEISRSLWDKKNEVSDFALTLFTTLPFVFIAALIVGYLVASRALSPVDKMISAAKQITARKLDRRLEVPESRDELARLAETLNAMINRLHNSFEEMRRFTADAAHDLRTPVAALRTEVEVCLMAERTSEEYRESLQVVLDEAIHLSRLTSQLLDLSREDHGVPPAGSEPVHLESIVKTVVEDFRIPSQQKQITIQMRKLAPLTVPGDQMRLRRVVMNLLDNAVRYTSNGGHIWIDGDRFPDRAVLVISDDGSGIPEEDLPFIFDRFRRVDKARNRQMGGTGLGLAICKSIIEAHGGTIKMESTLGKGTKVEVELPVAVAG
jgi:two-component system heavy metal sensor histidine kinase CusS